MQEFNYLIFKTRRRNQKKLEREFGYRSDKTSDNSIRFGNGMAISDSRNSSIREKGLINLPYSDTSNGIPVRGYENTHETIGKYKSRNNIGYDDSDYSIGGNLNSKPVIRDNIGSGFSPLNRSNYPRVDHDEYWRTNI